MQLNMSKFKKLKEDAKSATFQHPDGHSITIAKHVLSKEAKDEIKNMPLHKAKGGKIQKFDDGGPVASYEPSDQDQLLAEASTADNIPSPAPAVQTEQPLPPVFTLPTSMNDVGRAVRGAVSDTAAGVGMLASPVVSGVGNFVRGVSGLPETSDNASQAAAPVQGGIRLASNNDAGQVDQSSQTPQNTTPSQSTGQATMSGGPDYLQKGFNDQLQGQANLAKGLEDQAQQQALVLQKNEDDQKAALTEAQNHFDAAKQEIQAAGNDVRNNMIDPNRYWNNMSTPGKISTALGLVLGGMGAGLTHGSNMALDLLNKHIDNDIHAQSQNQNAYQNLLSQAHQGMNDAMNQANIKKAMGLEIAKTQLDKIAAQTQSPIIQARYQVLRGQIEQQQGSLLYQYGVNQTLNSGRMPASMAGVLPPEARERSVALPNGMLAAAATKEDADKYRTADSAYKNISDLLKRADQFNKTVGYALPLTGQAQEAEDIKRDLGFALRSSEAITRFNPEVNQMFGEMLGHLGGVRTDLADVQIKGLQRMLDSQRRGLVSTYLPNVAPPPPPSMRPPVQPPQKRPPMVASQGR